MGRRSLLLLGQLPEPGLRPRLSLAAKGFRPFFLLAALFASLIVPIWVFVLRGEIVSGRYLEPIVWHAHEMVFGFATAVIAGFLLTAVANWTQRETLTGGPLLGLAAIWCFGRIAMACASSLPKGVAAVIDLSFLPVLIAALARPLIASGNRRNFVMLAILTCLFGANLATHLDALALVAPGAGRRGCLVGVDVVVLVITIMAARVFPMFTRNATGAASVQSIPWLDGVSIAGMGFVVVLDVVAPEGRLAGTILTITGLAVAARTVRWGAHRTARQPLLWILHIGHAWVPVGLVLRALTAFGIGVPPSAGLHALTVGAVGGLCLGMMARVTLGHTGRPLVIAQGMAAGFVAVTLAALVRSLAPFLWPGHYLEALSVSAALWSAAFIIYVFAHARLLLQPRADGKPG